MGGLNKGSAFAMKSPLKQGAYEDPEQVDVPVDTSIAAAVTSTSATTANAISQIENNNNTDKNNQDEE